MFCRHSLIVFLLILGTIVYPAGASEHEAFFESKIRPLLIDQCWDCHSADNPESELQLDSLQGMLVGGTRGPAIVPGKPGESLLMHALRHSERLQMPPKAKLPAQDIANLARWITDGAVWPNHDPVEAISAGDDEGFAVTDEDRSFWSFRSPQKPPLPDVERDDWIRQPLDRFVLAELESQQLKPAPTADRRTLIRRATLDLHGVPPTPQEVETFIDDPRPDAYARLIERLLASPRYGERWGRHWLDVARYADSNGLDENLAHANAYRFRDYVIRVFNQDKSFDRFIHEQLAGDLLEPGKEESFDPIIATGFLSLGAKMLAEDDPVKMQMDIIDEQVDTIGRAFMGLTLGCARCHDHKFDPIPASDYYALAGVLKSTKTMDHFNVVAKWQERELSTAKFKRDSAQFEKDLADKQDEIKRLEATANQRVTEQSQQLVLEYLKAAARHELRQQLHASRKAHGDDLANVESHQLFEAESFVRGEHVVRDEENYGRGIGVIASRGTPQDYVEYDIEVDDEGWYQLDLRYAAVESRPCRLIVNQVELREVAAGTTGTWFPDSQKWHFDAIIKLPAGKSVLRLERNGPIPHIDKLLLVPIQDAPAWLSDDRVSESRTFPPLVRQWYRFLVDPAKADQPVVAAFQVWRQRQGLLAEWEELAAQFESFDPSHLPAIEESLESYWPAEEREKIVEARKHLETLRGRRPVAPTAMAVSDYEQPENLRVHLRGSHLTLGQEIPRRFLQIVAASDEFEITQQQSGRLELARWLTHTEHPLTARVIVNRLWLWHFGQGLVASPDNFGTLGQRPTHPELLDWLARELIDQSWSLKSMHRMLMNSATYRSSSLPSEEAVMKDPENRLLSHFGRRRLEAEAIRDSVLAVSGSLDLAMGGTHLPTKNRAYVTSTANVNPQIYNLRRRSVYLPIVRSALFEVLQSFDFPDPSVSTGLRQSTTVAPQALFMMNSEFVAEQTGLLAQQLLDHRQLEDADRVRRLYQRALGRRATDAEIQMAVDYVRQYLARVTEADGDDPEQPRRAAWQSLCRAVLSTNEFIYLD